MRLLIATHLQCPMMYPMPSRLAFGRRIYKVEKDYKKQSQYIRLTMEKREIEEKVNDFFVEEMEIETDKIAPDALLKEDLGLDSLDFVDIVVIVERTFGFKIKPEEMANVKTVKNFYDYIESKLKG